MLQVLRTALKFSNFKLKKNVNGQFSLKSPPLVAVVVVVVVVAVVEEVVVVVVHIRAASDVLFSNVSSESTIQVVELDTFQPVEGISVRPFSTL